MLSLPAAVKLWYCPDAVDMRLGFDGLFSLVKHRLRADPLSGCQGTRTFTQLVDTNLYAQNRSLRTARSNRGLLPTLPGRGPRSLLPAVLLFLVLPAFGRLASFARRATFLLPGETEAGSAGAQPTKG